MNSGSTGTVAVPPGRLRPGRVEARGFLAAGPGRLRVIAVLAMLGAVLLTVGGGIALYLQSRAITQARTASAHLVLLQGVRTSLLGADADATNAFLQLGLEPVAQRREFLSALGSASRDLALAARTSSSDGDDGATYGRATDALVRYSGLIESARINNRLGESVGSSYLRMASSLLRTGVLPELSRLTDADTDRLDAAYGGSTRASIAFVACAALGWGLLLLAQYRLARTTRRVFAVPVAVTSGVLLVAAVGSGIGCLLAASSAASTRDGSFARATALARARAAAFDAKSTESLTLIGRGSYPDGEQNWQAAMRTAADSARLAADPALVASLAGYTQAHTVIHRLDAAGTWREAVNRAVAVTPGSANAAFGQFDSRSAGLLTAAGTAVVADLTSAGEALPVSGAAIVLVGTATVIGAGRAVGSRLADYR